MGSEAYCFAFIPMTGRPSKIVARKLHRLRAELLDTDDMEAHATYRIPLSERRTLLSVRLLLSKHGIRVRIGDAMTVASAQGQTKKPGAHSEGRHR